MVRSRVSDGQQLMLHLSGRVFSWRNDFMPLLADQLKITDNLRTNAVRGILVDGTIV